MPRMRRGQVLELREVALNGGAIAATGDAGVHLVAYFGDANGNKASSADRHVDGARPA